MIPEGLEMTVGFLIGLVIGTSVGVALGGMLAMRGRMDAELFAFESGAASERARLERHSVPPVAPGDLRGDEGTEWGLA